MEARVTKLESTVNSIAQTQQHILYMFNNYWHPQYPLNSNPAPSAECLPSCNDVPVCTNTYHEVPTANNGTYNNSTEHSNNVTDEVELVKPLPLNTKLNNVPLPSSTIDTQSLQPVQDVVEINEHFITKQNTPGTLAQLLAREAIFGVQVMGQCTPTGSKKLRALPQQELMGIKTLIFKYYPHMWRSPEKFEDIWHVCQVAIEQCCGRIRRATQKKQ